jgi:hypothetical protein
MDRPTCKTCPFWDGPRSKEPVRGDCHGAAPTTISGLMNYPVAVTTPEDYWCAVHPDMTDWIQGIRDGRATDTDHEDASKAPTTSI